MYGAPERTSWCDLVICLDGLINCPDELTNRPDDLLIRQDNLLMRPDRLLNRITMSARGLRSNERFWICSPDFGNITALSSDTIRDAIRHFQDCWLFRTMIRFNIFHPVSNGAKTLQRHVVSRQSFLIRVSVSMPLFYTSSSSVSTHSLWIYDFMAV